MGSRLSEMVILFLLSTTIQSTQLVNVNKSLPDFTSLPLNPGGLVEINENTDDSILHYLKYYDLIGSNVTISIGRFPVNKFEIACLVFSPPNPKATVFLIHGYLDHLGSMNHLTKVLLNNGYAVVLYDLPGHGLSSGKRADIDSFASYRHVLEQVIRTVSEQLPKPFHGIGHSTGCVALLDMLMKNNSQPLQKIVLVAPLIRSAKWKLTKTGIFLTGWFMTSVPRIFTENTGNAKYLEFIEKNDPLQCKTVPLTWMRAMFAWNETIAAANIYDNHFLVLQGTEDSTVDWENNIEFIKKHFPKATVIQLSGGHHQLLNEIEDIQKEVFRQIITYFSEK